MTPTHLLIPIEEWNRIHDMAANAKVNKIFWEGNLVASNAIKACAKQISLNEDDIKEKIDSHLVSIRTSSASLNPQRDISYRLGYKQALSDLFKTLTNE